MSYRSESSQMGPPEITWSMSTTKGMSYANAMMRITGANMKTHFPSGAARVGRLSAPWQYRLMEGPVLFGSIEADWKTRGAVWGTRIAPNRIGTEIAATPAMISNTVFTG